MSLNKEGNTINKRGIAIMNPPITAIASGGGICAPTPVHRARGLKARITPTAVMSLNLILSDIA